MDFSAVTYWNLPEGKVKEVSRNGTKIWSDKIKLKSNGSVQFKGTKNATLPSATFYGKTEQTQLTGKNLLQIDGRTKYTKANITPTTSFDTQWLDKYIYKWAAAGYGRNDSDAGNVYSADEISFTQTQNWYGYGFALEAKPNTSYTISYETIEGNPVFGTTYYNASRSMISYSTAVANTFKTPEGTAYMILGFTKKNGGADSVRVTKLQLEEGTVATSYEPYCGGMPSPNPQYPQEIKVNNSAWKMTGFNLFDEKVELGGFALATGAKTSTTNQIRSTNYIKVIAGKQYYKYCGTATNNLYTLFWDKDFNYVGYVGAYPNTIVTAPENAVYMKFACVPDYGTEYHNDICINESQSNINISPHNGQYYPYGGLVDLSTIPLAEGNIYNSQTGLTTKIIKSIDLGTLSFTYNTSSGVSPYFTASLPDVKKNMSPHSTVSNALCESYTIALRTADKFVNGTFCIDIGYLEIKNTSYTDPEAFRASVSGKKLYYELEEPVTEQLTPQPLYETVGLNSFEQISGDIENTQIELEIYGKKHIV